MFDYTICNCADDAIFKNQCQAIEQKIPTLKKKPLLIDVDGTSIQEYGLPMGKICVKNDQQVDALYVQSDFDLRQYFKK